MVRPAEVNGRSWHPCVLPPIWLMTMPWSAWLKLIWCRVLLNDTGELDLVAKALPCLALRSSLEVLCRVSICTGLRPPVLTYSYNGYRDGWCSHRMWDKRNTLSRPSHARINCFCFTTRGRGDEWDAWDETTMHVLLSLYMHNFCFTVSWPYLSYVQGQASGGHGQGGWRANCCVHDQLAVPCHHAVRARGRPCVQTNGRGGGRTETGGGQAQS